MMNKHIGGKECLKKKMVTTATTLWQTATRNDWTTGISKSQHTYVSLIAEDFLMIFFTCFLFTA